MSVRVKAHERRAPGKRGGGYDFCEHLRGLLDARAGVDEHQDELRRLGADVERLAWASPPALGMAVESWARAEGLTRKQAEGLSATLAAAINEGRRL